MSEGRANTRNVSLRHALRYTIYIIKFVDKPNKHLIPFDDALSQVLLEMTPLMYLDTFFFEHFNSAVANGI